MINFLIEDQNRSSLEIHFGIQKASQRSHRSDIKVRQLRNLFSSQSIMKLKIENWKLKKKAYYFETQLVWIGKLQSVSGS